MESFDRELSVAGASYHSDCEPSNEAAADQIAEPAPAVAPVAETSDIDDIKVPSDDYDPCAGTWLHEELRLKGAGGAKLLDIVLMKIDVGGGGSQSKRRDHRARLERRVECVLANCIRTNRYRISDRVAYRRGSDGYAQRPQWLNGKSMRATVDTLSKLGLLKGEQGEWQQWKSGFEPGHASTFWASPALHHLMRECGVNDSSISIPLYSLEEHIRVRTTKDEDGRFDTPPFTMNDEVRTSAIQLQKYNRFAAQHEVSIDLSEGELAAQVSRHKKRESRSSRQPARKQPEWFSFQLHRIFNDWDTHPDFSRGGRLYGTWPQQVRKEGRSRITINDEPTIELDFSGMAIRMLYHLRGLEYLGDPYSIEELESYAMKRKWKRYHYREAIKQLLQALVNYEGDQAVAEQAKLDSSFRPAFTRRQIADLIRAKHSPIAHDFGSGLGKTLQRKDSDIALKVIVSCQENGILSIPIHDSFIVAVHHQALLHDVMTKSYRELIGFNPVIKAVLGEV